MAVLEALKLGGRHRKGPSAVWPPCPCMSATSPGCSVSRGRKRGSSPTLHSLTSPLFLGLFLPRSLVPEAMAESGWSSLLPSPLLCPSSSNTSHPSPPPSCRCCWLPSAPSSSWAAISPESSRPPPSPSLFSVAVRKKDHLARQKLFVVFTLQKC